MNSQYQYTQMERIRIYAPAVMLLLLAVSCIDKDIMNISDSVEINSRYSVPIGTYNTDINDYLESLDTLGPSSGDSLYYEDVLYPVNESYVDFTLSDSLNFNLIKDPAGKGEIGGICYSCLQWISHSCRGAGLFHVGFHSH